MQRVARTRIVCCSDLLSFSIHEERCFKQNGRMCDRYAPYMRGLPSLYVAAAAVCQHNTQAA